jgi:Flp pilus assembly protein TadG
MKQIKHRPQTRTRGSATVEYALVLIPFLMFLLGVLDFSRLLYTWNMANEATRAGARYAVVCADPTNNDRIMTAMQQRLPAIASIDVQWQPAGCNPATCEGVTVAVTDMQFTWIAPLPGTLTRAVIMMPGFSTYLPREMMRYDASIC